MAATDSFLSVMQRLKQGDERAAAQVFERFARRLIGLARDRLNRQIQPAVDAEDIMVSALRSFFSRKQYVDLDSWDSMWSYLVVIAVRKCIRENRRFATDKRDRKRQVTADEIWDAIGTEPTPADAALFADLLDHVMSPLDERERTIAALRLQGHTIPEISAQVRRTERTVHRVLAKVRTTLEEMDTQEDQ